jgi:hypothetical protein
MANYAKPNYSKSSAFEKTVFYQLKSKPSPVTSLTLRLGPTPAKHTALVEKGIWAMFIKTHFGVKMKVTKNDGGSVDIPQTYLCVEKTDRNKNVLVECPECNEVSLRKTKMEREKKRLEGENKTKEEVAVALKYQNQWLKEHNLDMKWHILAKDLSGKWGFLKISNKCKKKLDEKIKELVAKDIDPLSPERGVWLVFKRTDVDSWQDPGDLVDVHTEEDAEGNIKRKYDAFTDSDDTQLDKLPGLNEIGRKITPAQIRLLVESNGDEDVVKSIFNAGKKSEESAEPTMSVAEKPVPNPTAAFGLETTAPAVDDEEARLEAALAAARARKAAAATAQTTVAPVATGMAQVPSPKMQTALAQDMDSFMATFQDD